MAVVHLRYVQYLVPGIDTEDSESGIECCEDKAVGAFGRSLSYVNLRKLQYCCNIISFAIHSYNVQLECFPNRTHKKEQGIKTKRKVKV